MSDTLTSLGLLTLAQEYRGDIVKQINRKTATLRMLRVVPGEGKNIAWALEFDGAGAETYTEGADTTNFGGDAQSQGILQWGLYRTGIHVSKLAMDGAATSSTPVGNHQLWARQIVNNTGKLAQLLNQDLYAGDGTGTRMTGFSVAVDASTDYAGASHSTYSAWNSTVIAPGSLTAITFALIRDDIRQIYEACGETPDLAGTTPAVFNKVGALFDNTRRQIDSVRGGNGEVKLEFGFQALEVDGTVFFKDKDCTAQTIYYLNSEHVEIQYLPSAEQNMLMAAGVADVQVDDGFGPVPLGFHYEKLAKTGPADKGHVLWTGNLKVNRRNTCGKRTNVLDS